MSTSFEAQSGDLLRSAEILPLITIGITCYSEGQWLLECWQSVLAQSDDRWMAVLVMDGTPHEPTREIFTQLKHPKLRKYAMPQNEGPYPSRNKAFELTETPYHFYLDGDDQLLPGSIATVLNTFSKHPDAGFVYGDYKCFGTETGIARYPHSYDAEDLVVGQPVPGACAYQTAVWKQLGGFAPELARGNADYDFLIGATELGIKGRHCGEIFYQRRVRHSDNVSESYCLRQQETYEVIVKRHPAFFRERRRRDRFLAASYFQAARANRRAGNLNAAVRLASNACRLLRSCR